MTPFSQCYKDFQAVCKYNICFITFDLKNFYPIIIHFSKPIISHLSINKIIYKYILSVLKNKLMLNRIHFACQKI